MSTQNLTNNIISNKESVTSEPYELSDIISPMFGLNCQTIVNSKTKPQKINSASTPTLEQYVEQKTKVNIISEKVENYTNTTSLDNSRMAQIEKTKKQQAIYETLPSRYLEFREKITVKNNYNPTNDTIITTIDLLVDDILDEK